MNIAVLISGQLRDYKVNVQNHLKQLIEPNSCDVFAYVSIKNTIHTIGDNITQKYVETTEQDPDELTSELISIYGKYLKGFKIMAGEPTSDTFGTVGYFKRMMHNQMDNIRECFKMAKEHEKATGIVYDAFIRCRPDNSMFPSPVTLYNRLEPNRLYTTQYPSGWKDPWFFAFADSDTFDKYCSFDYLPDVDESSTDNNFPCPEYAIMDYFPRVGIEPEYIPNICRPFYGFNKEEPVEDFPFRDGKEKLISSDGELVEQVVNKNG